MGKKLIIGNWKMNLNIHEASLYVYKLAERVEVHRDVEVVLAPTMLALQTVVLQADFRQFKIASQNFHWRDEGAFTGEVSANHLRGLVKYGIIGHSERRHIFGETDKDIRNKVQAAYRNGITPVLCVGENAVERSTGETNDVLHHQIVGGLSNITSEEARDLVIAYEPVWAVGTGHSAVPGDVARAVRSIRSQVKHLFGDEVSQMVRVLYGGSVTLGNAKAFLDITGIDGLLIGGASLDAHVFSEISNSAHTPTKKGVN